MYEREDGEYVKAEPEPQSPTPEPAPSEATPEKDVPKYVKEYTGVDFVSHEVWSSGDVVILIRQGEKDTIIEFLGAETTFAELSASRREVAALNEDYEMAATDIVEFRLRNKSLSAQLAAKTAETSDLAAKLQCAKSELAFVNQMSAAIARHRDTLATKLQRAEADTVLLNKLEQVLKVTNLKPFWNAEFQQWWTKPGCFGTFRECITTATSDIKLP